MNTLGLFLYLKLFLALQQSTDIFCGPKMRVIYPIWTLDEVTLVLLYCTGISGDIPPHAGRCNVPCLNNTRDLPSVVARVCTLMRSQAPPLNDTSSFLNKLLLQHTNNDQKIYLSRISQVFQVVCLVTFKPVMCEINTEGVPRNEVRCGEMKNHFFVVKMKSSRATTALSSPTSRNVTS